MTSFVSFHVKEKSWCEAGLVMVTNVMTGVVLRRVSDHSGAPITGIDVRKELVQVL